MRTGIGDEYATLFHYFLGELPEGEQEAVEERYMLDEAYAELRDEVEMDLVDAYVAGTLTPLERRHFERHYMVTRERREGVKAAYLSRVYRERIARPAARAPSAHRLAFLPERSMIPAMAAALVVIAMAGASWLIYESWEIHREIRGVVQTAVNRPVRPPGGSQGAGIARSEPGSSGPPPLAPQRVPPKTSVITAAPPEDKADKGDKQQPAPAPAPAPAQAAPIEPPSQALQTRTTTAAHLEDKDARRDKQEPAPAPASASAEVAPVPIEPPSQALQTSRDTPPVYARDQSSRAAIQRRLESEYQLTKVSDDNSDIVTAGSVLVLHKDKLLMVAATSTANPCMNNYKDGKISPTKACGVGEKLSRLPGFAHVPGGSSAPATRNFVTGEKFWVTKIDVRDSGVVLNFFTDATPAGDQGVRYKGSLTIPFGALMPTPEEVLKVVAEVITVAPPEDKDAKRDQQQPAVAPVPVPTEAPPAATEPSPPPTVKISLGQTPEQVVAVLGSPLRTAKVGTKDIYFYQDVKVTFVDGKLTDIQ
jgi:hypothetical protein